MNFFALYFSGEPFLTGPDLFGDAGKARSPRSGTLLVAVYAAAAPYGPVAVRAAKARIERNLLNTATEGFP